MSPTPSERPGPHRRHVVTILRWAFLVFNLAVATGFMFYLQWQREPVLWVVWTTRSLITAQLAVAIVAVISALRHRVDGASGIEVTAEAWVYFGMSCAGAFTMALSMN